MDEQYDENLFKIFINESNEQLDKLVKLLLGLEKKDENSESINGIFRLVHSLKSSSAAMGFNKMSELSHAMEDLLQCIRDKKFYVNDDTIETLFICYGFLKNSIDYVTLNREEDVTKIGNIDKLKDKLSLIIKNGINQITNSQMTDSKYENIEGDGFFCIDERLLQNLGNELSEHIKNMRIAISMIDIDNKSENKSAIYKLFKEIHTIRSLFGFIDYEEPWDLSLKTEKLINYLLKNPTNVNGEILNIITVSCDLIDGFCDTSEEKISKNKYFLEETKNHIMKLELQKQKYEDCCQEENIISDIEELDETFMHIPTNKIENLDNTLGELLIFQSIFWYKSEKSFGVGDRIFGSLNRMYGIIKDMQEIVFKFSNVKFESVLKKIVWECQDIALRMEKKSDI